MSKNFVPLSLFLLVISVYAQDGITKTNKRIKVDGVAVVIGKNIVLDSDIDKFEAPFMPR